MRLPLIAVDHTSHRVGVMVGVAGGVVVTDALVGEGVGLEVAAVLSRYEGHPVNLSTLGDDN